MTVSAAWLFNMVPRVSLQCVIVVFDDISLIVFNVQPGQFFLQLAPIL